MFIILSLITDRVETNEVIYNSNTNNYYKVIGREGSVVELHACDENGFLSAGLKTMALRDRKLIGSQVWKKVIKSFFPPKHQ